MSATAFRTKIRSRFPYNEPMLSSSLKLFDDFLADVMPDVIALYVPTYFTPPRLLDPVDPGDAVAHGQNGSLNALVVGDDLVKVAECIGVFHVDAGHLGQELLLLRGVVGDERSALCRAGWKGWEE